MYSEIARAQRSVVSLVVGQRLPDDARRWVRGRSGLGPPWVRVKSAGIMGWVQRSALPRAHTPARARTRDEQPALPHPLCVRDFTRTTRTQCPLARNDGKKWVQVYPDPMAIQSDPGRTRLHQAVARQCPRVLPSRTPCGHRKSQFFRRRAGCRIGSQVGGLGCAADVIHRHMGRGHG